MSSIFYSYPDPLIPLVQQLRDAEQLRDHARTKHEERWHAGRAVGFAEAIQTVDVSIRSQAAGRAVALRDHTEVLEERGA